MKDSPSPPAAPDYTAAATAQGQANVEAARVQGRMNNPNVYTPYGSQQVYWGNNAPTSGGGAPPASPSTPQAAWGSPDSISALNNAGLSSRFNPAAGSSQWYDGASGQFLNDTQAQSKYSSLGGTGGTGGGGDQPTIVQTLNPQSQQIFDAQQRTRQGLADLSNVGAGIAQGVLNHPFSFNGPGVQTSVGSAGQIQGSPNLFGFGQAGANVNAGGINQGPNAGQYGTAQGGVAAPNLQGSIDTSGIAQAPINAGTTAQQAIMSRLEPALQRQRTSTETQLINQGLRPGGEAYDNAATLLGQQENDQRTQAALQGLNLDMAANQQGFGQAQAQGQFGNQAALSGFGANLQNQQAGNAAIGQNFGQGLQAQNAQNAAQQQGFAQSFGLQGLQNQAIGQNQQTALQQQQAANTAQGQQYNQNLQSGQFGNTAQNQAMVQALQQRGLPLNEITALMSGSQITSPQFQGYQGSNVQPAPIMQAASQQFAANQGLYNQQVGQQNAMTQGLFSLGGAALMAPTGTFSDRRLKRNIVRIGTHRLGIGIYEYDIFSRHEIGVMADEVERVMPSAVVLHPSGAKMVDYGRL